MSLVSKKPPFSIVLLLLVHLLTSTNPDGAWTAQGATYYVATAGRDSNPGSATQPWQTIQKAANTLKAGDMVLIRSGTYHERVLPANSGTDGQEIVYAAYPGETVTLDGSGVALPDDLVGLFEVLDRSHVRLSGLRIINAGIHNDNAGILVRNSHFISVQNNCTSNTFSSGIGVWDSDHVTVASNSVDLACTGGWQEGISVAITDTFEVRNNQVAISQKEGICIKQGSCNGTITLNRIERAKVGIYLDAWDRRTYNLEVGRNTVRDCQDDGIALSSEMGGSLENVFVHDNIAYHSGFIGLVISTFGPGGPKGEHPMNGLSILNNTIYNNGWEWGGGIAMDNPDALKVLIGNNLCSQNLSFQITVGSDVSLPSQQVTIDHNLIDGFRADPEGETYGLAYVEGDPQFVNPAAEDFHLKPTSPAIDAGANQPALLTVTDIDGQPRIFNGRVDIGADEYVSQIGKFKLSPLLLPDGRFQLTISGEARRAYSIEASANLMDWLKLTNLFSVTPAVVFVDEAASSFTWRFYRAVYP